MRYYSLIVSDPNTGQVWKPDYKGGFVKSPGGSTFSSQAVIGGRLQSNPGALNIEFDIPVTAHATPQGGSIIRVSGIGLQMIGRAANLNGQNFILSAGMAKGLPLANPQQRGVVAQGKIFQAFGNWQGVDQTLDLICNPGGLDPEMGVSFSWAPGTPLATALFSALTQGFPGYKVKVDVSAQLQPAATQSGCYKSLSSFAQYLQGYTQPLGAQFAGSGYPGVQITTVGNTLRAFDGTVESDQSKTVELAFQDLIGQPTWIGALEVSFKTVLRADIQIGDKVVFPQGIIPPYALTSPTAAVPNAPSRSKVVFRGAFNVKEVHHFANFRQPDGDSWNTTFVANVIPAAVSLLGAR